MKLTDDELGLTNLERAYFSLAQTEKKPTAKAHTCKSYAVRNRENLKKGVYIVLIAVNP